MERGPDGVRPVVAAKEVGQLHEKVGGGWEVRRVGGVYGAQAAERDCATTGIGVYGPVCLGSDSRTGYGG